MTSLNKTHFVKLLLPLALVLLLGSGCMKVDMAIVVEADGTGSYTGDIAVFKGLGEMFDEGGEGDNTQICEGLLDSDGDSPIPDLPLEAKVDTYEDDEWCGASFSVNFTGFGQSVVDAGDDPFPLSIAGNMLTFSVPVEDLFGDDSPLSDEGDDGSGLDGDMDVALMLKAFGIPEPEFRMHVTLPGEILEHNATSQDGSTLTWEIDIFELEETNTDIFAIADISKSAESGSSKVGIIVGIAVAAGIITLAGLNFVKKRQETPDEDSVL
jgi:hypothetical protein